MSIKKFGQDGEYQHFFFNKKFLFLHFLPLCFYRLNCHFLFTKSQKKLCRLRKKNNYIPRRLREKIPGRFQKVIRIIVMIKPC